MVTSDSESDVGNPRCTQDGFKDVVKEFIRIHDRLAEIRKDSTMLNKRKKKLSEVILTFMKDTDKSFCNLGGDGTLEMRTSKTKLALKKDHITSLLQQYGNNEEQAKQVAEYLWSNKVTKERNVLKRSVRPID